MKLNGASFALQYKRTTPRPIDVTMVWNTLAEARAYARNTDTDVYMPYAGQVVSVLADGEIYKLVADNTVTQYPERTHCRLEPIKTADQLADDFLEKDSDTVQTVDSDVTFNGKVRFNGTGTDTPKFTAAEIDELKIIAKMFSDNYTAGVGGFGIYKDEQGNWHLQTDFLDVEKKMEVTEMEVQKSTHVGGQVVNSAATMKVSRVVEEADGYKCYFNRTDADGNTIENQFAVGDLGYYKTTNLTNNNYYWREVTATGDDFIKLSKTSCDTNSGVPQVGDSISACGNVSDPSRQNVLMFSSVGEGAPFFRLYRGINTFSFTSGTMPFSADANGVTVKGTFISEGSGQSIDENISSISNVVQQLSDGYDNMYVMYFGTATPTLNNYPATEWTDDNDDFDLHLNDMFYKTDDGTGYRFRKSSVGDYYWELITDRYVLQALSNAAAAQQTATTADNNATAAGSLAQSASTAAGEAATAAATADGKAVAAQNTANSKTRTFLSKPQNSDTYSKGDIWVDAPYKVNANGTLTSTSDSSLKTTLVCQTAKAQGAAFSISHWRGMTRNVESRLIALGQEVQAAVGENGTVDAAIQAAKQAAIGSTSDASALSITDKFITSLGVLYQRDSSGNIVRDNNGNPIIQDGGGLVTTATYNQLWQSTDPTNIAYRVKQVMERLTTDLKDNNNQSMTLDSFIQNTNKSNALISQKFDSDGNLLALSGMVTKADMATMFSDLYTENPDTHEQVLDQSKLVLKGNLAQLMAQEINAAGTTIQAKIEAMIDNGVSTAIIQADKINFIGKTIINDNFVVDEQGNLTLNNITANNGKFTGEVNANSGSIGGFRISGNSLEDNNQLGAHITIRYSDNSSDIEGSIGKLQSNSGGYEAGRFVNTKINGSTNTALYIEASMATTSYLRNVAIEFGGGYMQRAAFKVAEITQSSTIDIDTYCVIANNSSSDITITLPKCRPYDHGHVVKIKTISRRVYIKPGTNYSANSDTTTRDSVIFAERGTTYTNTSQYQLQSNGDASEFIFFWNKGTGTWYQFKNPRDW